MQAALHAPGGCVLTMPSLVLACPQAHRHRQWGEDRASTILLRLFTTCSAESAECTSMAITERQASNGTLSACLSKQPRPQQNMAATSCLKLEHFCVISAA